MIRKYHWESRGIQLAFTLFVVTETWLVPVEGWFVDRYGPRVVDHVLGGVLVALAWVINSSANSLAMLYLGRDHRAASAPARSTAPASATR